MDKQDLIKILVVVVAVSFLTEIFAFRGNIPFFDFSPAKVAQNFTGTAVFNGSIRTYDPYLLIPATTSKDIIEGIKGHDGVKDVSLQTEGYVVQTETRDDVFPIANYLLAMNISSQTVANIVVPQILVVTTSTGTKNASAAGIVRVATEPLLEVDSPVTVQMTAIVSDSGELVDYRAATIIRQTLEGDFDARVVKLDSKSYSYMIPWENRTQVGNLSSYGKADYRELDSIVFTTPLSAAQVLAKKLFPYIVYIDTGSAMVEPGFTNASQVALNFADANYSLPSSKLTIYSNSTGSEDPLPDFNATVLYSYDIAVDAGGYDFGSAPLVLSSGKGFSENETVKVHISAVALGNRIILVRSVSIPS